MRRNGLHYIVVTRVMVKTPAAEQAKGALTTLGFAERFTRYLMDCAVYRFSDPQIRSPLIQLFNLKKVPHAS